MGCIQGLVSAFGHFYNGARRTTTCPCLARPSSNDSLKASTMIRIRWGVKVNLCADCTAVRTGMSLGKCEEPTRPRICGGGPPSSCDCHRSLETGRGNGGRMAANVLLGSVRQAVVIFARPCVGRKSLSGGEHYARASASASHYIRRGEGEIGSVEEESSWRPGAS